MDHVFAIRESTVERMLAEVPYVRWLGVRVDRRGDELTAVLPFSDRLIGNPVLPALHGGVTAAFLETTAVLGLVWAVLGEDGRELHPGPDGLPRLPKTIDFTIDYLRSAGARDAYARARVVRLGRRYASVQVEAWQDSPERPFAQASGHFLMAQG
ncbi:MULTISPECIES: PaaI family thioesterase [unclassified Paracoccus (in: a-proteobacteria)]|uniref:PaaI family thioesterase n=1 Tax=unclassified Paracoccus (in: a-proteobacteria) TaxID=2688777 RepID=UPI0016021094|nr:MULTISPECIES: PaaI family thioesterase [unclassified Paracoccus (in: a-proteobacteria)]MBB1490969.1 PaaI family thioesterase [Paracoccus sp. MC1854]MBB1498892.1 PaaI family thioesterase [Paracoccus sp. MC1862]QQO45183.1 PaaI family thioesterase [Paracoccus sp. MC1862]